jgi:hypothetical protein
MDYPHTDKPTSSFVVLTAMLFAAVIGAGCGILGTTEYKDREFAQVRAFEADKPPLVLGNGSALKAPGTTVLLGPVTIAQNPGHATMPVFVQDNDKTKALVCLLLDEKKRLLAGGSIPLPPRLTGTDLNVDFQRKITSGSVQCSLVKP